MPKFLVISTKGDKVMLHNESNKRRITPKQQEVELLFLPTALNVIRQKLACQVLSHSSWTRQSYAPDKTAIIKSIKWEYLLFLCTAFKIIRRKIVPVFSHSSWRRQSNARDKSALLISVKGDLEKSMRRSYSSCAALTEFRKKDAYQVKIYSNQRWQIAPDKNSTNKFIQRG